MKILHVVRRYGPVGGMERYVWEITRELGALGHQVTVVCERCHVEKPQGIIVHELGEIAARPRWLSLLRFSNRVACWLEQNPHHDFIIHSNERLGTHDVTTFHGPPFATVRDKPWWEKASLRVAMQFYLERRELNAARYIVPNSIFIKEQLAHYYPEYAHKLTAPIVPGVAAMAPSTWQGVPIDGGIIGFVGKEWQRKGLPLVMEIVLQLRQTRPKLELWVVGPQPQEIEPLFSKWQGGYRLLGWRSDTAYLQEIDILLHPARAEPYGMVIAEAMAAQVPVVVSDVCGAAAQIVAEAGDVVPLDASLDKWVGAVTKQLQRIIAPPRYQHGWGEVAQEYEKLYRDIDEAKAHPLITVCPNGCKGPLRNSDLLLREGALKYCPSCGQLVSSCSKEQYVASNLEWDTESGTWPSKKDMKRLAQRREKTVKVASRLLSKPYSEMHLLDIGCSSGAFVWIAQNMGVDAEGVEPTEKPVATAREKGLKVHQGLLHEVGFPENSFDVITLFEVIEHLDEPATLLKECYRILRPGGILVIGTGNTDSWTRKIRGIRWDFFDMHQHGGHVNFFSSQSIGVLAAATGFAVAKVRTTGLKFYQKEEVGYFFYRLSKAAAEILSIPAMLLNRGHQMEAFLKSKK